MRDEKIFFINQLINLFMKKITLLLMAAMLLPLTMNAEVKDYVQQNKRTDKIVVSTTPTAVKATKTVKFAAVPKADVPEGYASVTLTAGDVWGDGSGYQMLLDEDAIAYGTTFPETGALTTSGNASAAVYAEFEYKIPENADGALTTTNMVINSSVTILIPAGIYDWCITNPTPGDRMWIASDNGNVGGRADDYEFASGAAYEFVVTLGASGNDQTDVTIDDPTAPTIPTDVAVLPDATMANVAWVAGENNASWNLRWRPWTDPALMSPFWTFPFATYEDELEGWTMLDADQDGNAWSLAFSSDAEDDVCFYSASYESGLALSPDNWLFTPEVTLGGTLKFDLWQQSASFPDKIMVYVCDNPAWQSTDEFVAVSEFLQPAGTTATTYEIDLSEYEGTGIIAFRHYDCTDQWAIYLDNIYVEVPDAVEPAEWTVVENVDNPYTIEGLMPETKYETQVQAVGPDGRVTDWTDVVEFTTTAGEVPVEEGYFLVGTFNDWNQTAEGGRLAFDDENRVEVELQDGDEFKVITPAEDGGWTWLGGVDDNNVGYFLVTPELLSYELDLIDGANFRVQEGGIYHINLIWERTEGLPSHIVVTLAGPKVGS